MTDKGGKGGGADSKLSSSSDISIGGATKREDTAEGADIVNSKFNSTNLSVINGEGRSFKTSNSLFHFSDNNIEKVFIRRKGLASV